MRPLPQNSKRWRLLVQDTDRKAFDEILGEIFAAIDKPLGEAQRSVFWKGLKDMSILEFARCRDLLVKEFREMEDPPRKFTIGDLWRARKKLRVVAPPKDDTPQWQGDVWDQVANNQLLRHITTRMAADSRCWGHRTEPRFGRNVNVLVAFKNRWASLMREAAGPDGVLPKDQRDMWENCMRMAEREIVDESKEVAA
jgi:hypothetical protein